MIMTKNFIVFICKSNVNSGREPYLLTTLGACIPNSGRLSRTLTVGLRAEICLIFSAFFF